MESLENFQVVKISLPALSILNVRLYGQGTLLRHQQCSLIVAIWA